MYHLHTLIHMFQIIILSIYVPSTHAYTHLLRSIPRFALREKVTLRLLKLPFFPRFALREKVTLRLLKLLY